MSWEFNYLFNIFFRINKTLKHALWFPGRHTSGGSLHFAQGRPRPSQANSLLLRCIQSSPSTIMGIWIHWWRILTMQKQISWKELEVHIIFNTRWSKMAMGVLQYHFTFSSFFDIQRRRKSYITTARKGRETRRRKESIQDGEKKKSLHVHDESKGHAFPPVHPGHNREHTTVSTFTSIVSLLPAVCTPLLIHWQRADYPKDIIDT